jgi:hypothetical protein
MVMDRLADVRSALQPAGCVLQKAMDRIGEGAADVGANLEEVLIWAKGADTLCALPSGLDALLERRIEDAAREVEEMQAQNSFPLKSIRAAAQAILGAGERAAEGHDVPPTLMSALAANEHPQPSDSPFLATIPAMCVCRALRQHQRSLFTCFSG